MPNEVSNSFAAHQQFAVGLQRSKFGTLEALSDARDSFREALKKDSEYAQAYAAKADAETEIATWLRKLSPYQCRVLALFGEPAAMPDAALIRAANFYVNAAASEGACLPLMAAMAAGRHDFHSIFFGIFGVQSR